jgi:hypothetical protein
MRDLYKHLGLGEAAADDQIRMALDEKDPEIQSAAKSILLDNHRRRVYDRNRRLLVTVGQLRSRLGLSLSPFWIRGAFADFTFDVVPGFAGASIKSSNGQHLADPLEVLRAFDVGQTPRRRRRRRSKAQKWLIIASAITLLLVLAVVIFVWWKWSQYVTL